MKLRGLTASIDDAGDVVYRDKSGTERARTPHGFMTDSAIDPASGEPALSTGVTYALVPRGKGVALEVRLDRAWLDDPARAYPVTVDPYIATASWGDDTYVMSGFRRDASYDAELKVGTYDGGAHIGRSYVHFDTSLLAGATVTRAEMHAAERWSWNCGYWPEAAYRVTQGWNGRTMVDFPGAAVDPNWAGGTWAGPGCNNRTAIWNVTGFAAYWAAVGETQGSISLRATNEGDNNRWKKYNSAEVGGSALHVWYNHAPVTPVSVSPTNGQRVLSPSTPLSATYADADGTTGYVAFGIWNPAGQMIWSAWSPPVCASWCPTSVAGPWLPDGWYYVQTAGWDGQYVSAFSAPQWFFVDTRPPPPPTAIMPANNSYVSSPVTASALYTEPYGFAGNVLFWVLDPAGNYVTGAWSPTTAYGARATVTLPPLNVGTYQLYVLASDGALSGWAPPQTFTVAKAPGAPTGLQATAGALSGLLSWVAPLLNGAPITKLDFTATDVDNGQSKQFSCTGSCVSDNTAIFPDLLAGRNYRFTATATNAMGTSPVSPAAPASPGLITVRDAAALTPTSITAVPGDQSATVSWAQPFNIPPATAWRVYVHSTDDNGQPSVQIVDTTANPTTIGGLRNGTTYTFGVQAVARLALGSLVIYNVESPESTERASTVPFGPPFAPANLQVNPGNTTLAVTWEEPAAMNGVPGNNGNEITGYVAAVFEADQDPLGTPLQQITTDAATRGVTFTNLINGQEHFTAVGAINAGGRGAIAQSDGRIPAGPPFEPESVVATVLGPRDVSVSWLPPDPRADGATPGDNGAPITAYSIVPTPECPMCNQSGSGLAKTISGLRSSTEYTFQVKAANERGVGPPSDPSEPVTTESIPLDPPTAVRATKGFEEAYLTWMPPLAEDSPVVEYTIECSGCGTIVRPGSISETTVAGLTNGNIYAFVVVAKNARGETARSEPSNAVTPNRPKYAALGDSYSSGEGASGDDPPCNQSPQAYGPVYANELAPSPRPDLVFLACTGETIEGLVADQIPFVPSDTDLVTLTIGINNIDATGIIKYCIPLPNCESNYPDKAREIRALLPLLVDAFTRLLDQAPNARIVALTYPQIFSDTDDANCGIYLSVDGVERRWIRDRFADLDQVIADAVEAVESDRLSVLSELSAFDGHDMCASEPYVNAFVNSEPDDSFHPTNAGFRRMAEDLDANLDGL